MITHPLPTAARRRPLSPPLLAAIAVLVAGCEVSPFNFGSAPVTPRGEGPWQKPSVSKEQKTADIRDCYTVAEAQVARDRRIDQDIAAGDSGVGATGSQELQRSLAQYGYERRRREVFVQCMYQKGYDRD
jgi:type IV pilus biogenesis protein CpaD/CtpE